MAKPNYSYEKRQRELEKKRKKAEKAERKKSGVDGPAEDGAAVEEPGTEAAAPAPAPAQDS